MRDLQGKLQDVDGIAIIPNPAHASDGHGAQLTFVTHLDGEVNADMIDMLGNVVVNLANGPMAVGKHTLTVPTNQMVQGTYFARIRMSNGYTVVRKFVLEKQ